MLPAGRKPIVSSAAIYPRDAPTREWGFALLPMKSLGKPPATPTKMATKVFRCDGCNVI
jgi:hypothetical protein